MKLMIPVIAAVALGASVQSSSAAIVLQDNFDGPAAQGNWPGDAVFLSIPQPGNVSGLPSVDLVGPGFFPSLAFSGNSVDLDGSTGSGNSPSGQLQSVASFALGDYTLSFVLSGNQRFVAEQTTTISLGGQSFSITPTDDVYHTYTHTFVGASGQLNFVDSGPSNQQGNLLDNVVMASVPEPSTWAMLLLGFAGIGFMAYRRKSKPALMVA
jgi:PEP-CTERM motif